MRKVALLTMQRSSNYGAVLQAYALQQSIRRLGADCEILDLLRPLHAEYRATPRSAPLAPYRVPKLLTPGSLRAQVKRQGRWLLDSILGITRRRRFQRFDQEQLTYSRDTFRCVDDLYAASLDYDAYVTGSDQVWNPTYPYTPEPYFLTFVPEGVPRIAYAPSFGVGQIDAAVHEKYRTWLNGITRLSVRERQGADIIRELTGRSAEVVMDPTLLLTESDWTVVAKGPGARKPYIFCYALGGNSDLAILCRHLQSLTGCDLYRLGNADKVIVPGFRTIRNAGPREFLGWIRNAAIVVTNSFHGTVLSVNMQKTFFAIPSADRGPNSRNSRLESVLDTLALRDRLWTPAQALPAEPSLHISYGEASQRLLIERAKSLRFLGDSLNV